MSSNDNNYDVTIREAVIQDLDSIIKLGNTVEEFQVSDEVVTFWPEHILKKIILSESDVIIVATNKERTIGFIITNYNPIFSKAIIENIYVEPAYRGKGVSDILRDFLLKKLKSIGCEYVCALVESSGEEAIKSYERYGFNRGIDCVWLDLIINDSFAQKY